MCNNHNLNRRKPKENAHRNALILYRGVSGNESDYRGGFVDKLKECAVAFSNLLNVEYHITAGKKSNLIEVKLFFSKEHFYHLIGLHKLKDIQKTRGDKAKIFNKIIADKLTYNDLVKSEFFIDISDRFDYLTSLENMLDSDNVLIKHNKHKSKSSIQADYIIYTVDEDNIIHYFIERDSNVGKYFGKTFFARTDRLFLWDKPYKILKKIKFIDGRISAK